MHLANLSIFKLIDSENENMLFKNHFRFEIFHFRFYLMGILDTAKISCIIIRMTINKFFINAFFQIKKLYFQHHTL